MIALSGRKTPRFCRFAKQALKFGSRACGENTEDRQHACVGGKRPTIDNRHVPEDPAINVLKRHSQVTHQARVPGIRSGWKEFDETVGKVDQAALVDHLLAGSPGDVEAVILHELTVHPEREGMQLSFAGPAAGHHGTVDVERLGQVFDQRAEEPFAGLLGRTLEDGAERGVFVQSVGKIAEVFLGRGIGGRAKTKNNADGMAKALEALDNREDGLIFVNLVDFDQLYGHRNDVVGYAAALEEADGWIPGLLARLQSDDLVILTADHGCDPTTPSTDHSREYVPLLVYGPRAKRGVDLGTRATLADIGQTVAENFGVKIEKGVSFISAIV